jgi:hypothetical protein
MNESTPATLAVPATTSQDVLTEILRDGAQRLLSQAVTAEVATPIASSHAKKLNAITGIERLFV